MEVLSAKLELMAATDEVMRLVRRGAAFGPEWSAARERHDHTIKNWRRVVSRAHLPEMSLTAPMGPGIPLGAARYE
jgi:thiamine biosynthesis protein ThiC